MQFHSAFRWNYITFLAQPNNFLTYVAILNTFFFFQLLVVLHSIKITEWNLDFFNVYLVGTFFWFYKVL